MLESKYDEARARYMAALGLFQQLGEPATEAVCWHQLGMLAQQLRQWDEAERHYRESARLEEQCGNLFGAAKTWHQLAVICQLAGKEQGAEQWYRKAIEGMRAVGDRVVLGKSLGNLAVLLHRMPGRQSEARAVAHEVLALKQELDPAVAELWKTHELLSAIAAGEAEAEADAERKSALLEESREHARRARQARRRVIITRQEMTPHLPLVLATVGAALDGSYREPLEQLLAQREQHGWGKLVAVLRRIVAGERDVEALCDGLDAEDSMIVDMAVGVLTDEGLLDELIAVLGARK
jgi:hypothetical protein